VNLELAGLQVLDRFDVIAQMMQRLDGGPLQQVAERAGVSEKTVHQWVQTLVEGHRLSRIRQRTDPPD
jgi:DNA-binding IclR family transcriptional regulator